MPAFYPNTGQIWLAGIARTALANSVVSLYKNTISPNVLTTKAQLEAAEADYTGYLPLTITAWGAAFLSALGAAIQMPNQQFQPTGTAIGNLINGAWVETTGGVLVSIITFPESVPMGAVTDAIPLSEILRFGSGL